MSKKQALVILMAPILTLAFLVTVAPPNQKAGGQTFGSAYTPDAMQAYSLNMQPDNNGQYTVRSNKAAHDWHPGTDVPDRRDGEVDLTSGKRNLRWPIVGIMKSGMPQIMWFGKIDPGDAREVGKFRASNWSQWTTPERWAYLRLEPEVWNPLTKRMEVPGLPGSPPATTTPPTDPTKPLPKSLRYGVDSLKIRYTTGDILRAIDESPFNEPSEGAPEEGGAAPL